MNHNESTDTKELTPITENHEEARGIVPLDKKEDATGNGNTILGGLQNWLWGFGVSLPVNPELETITKAVELIVSQPTLPPVTPTSLPPRLIGPSWPFSLLQASCDVSVDINGVRQAPRLFDVRSDWKPSKAKELQKP